MSTEAIVSINLAAAVFMVYAVASFISKNPIYLVIYVCFEALMFFKFFDPIYEFERYLIALIAYSYLITNAKKVIIQVSCSIMAFICLLSAGDAFWYEETETVYHGLVEYIFTVSHIFIAVSIIYRPRILSDIINSIDLFLRGKGYPVYKSLYRILSKHKQNKGSVSKKDREVWGTKQRLS